ncbi:MAG: hypothetical protein ACFE96_10255 [Candidatus Hermodarchaeota archaeon]
MHKKAEKILLISLIGILFIISTNDNSIQENQKEIFESPNISPVYSTLIIRPNGDYVNPYWDSSPISDKINDSIVYPTAGGDSDFVVGNSVGDWCEVRMGDISLQSNQVVTKIRIFARGRQASPGLNTQRVDFDWRIGTASTYSAPEGLKFDGTSFYWQSTSFWDDLELDETEVNALQIRMEIGGGIQYQPGQAISVMYVSLTVKTNNPPSVNLTYPNGGETLYDSALVEWNYNDPDGDSVSFDLSYRIDGGSWTPIVINLVDETNYLWNLSSFTQTYINVEFLIEASDGDTGYANDTSSSFMIKVNRDPIVNLISPDGGEVLRDDTLIQWTYNDIDADSVFFNISHQINGGVWIPIVNELENHTSYLWDLSGFSQNYYNMSVKILAYDAFGGYSVDNSSDYFMYKVNSNPTVNLNYPNGGESLYDSVLILWNYTDPDGDTVTFNLYYTTGEAGWQEIVTGLVNGTSFEWNLQSFSITSDNVTIKIEANDGYGGFSDDHTIEPITIRKYETPSDFVPIIPFLILGVSILSSGLIITGLFIRKRRHKSKQPASPENLNS